MVFGFTAATSFTSSSCSVGSTIVVRSTSSLLLMTGLQPMTAITWSASFSVFSAAVFPSFTISISNLAGGLSTQMEKWPSLSTITCFLFQLSSVKLLFSHFKFHNSRTNQPNASFLSALMISVSSSKVTNLPLLFATRVMLPQPQSFKINVSACSFITSFNRVFSSSPT